MDSLDVKLLNLLQQDCRRTTAELTEHVALTPSAISRRLKRLRDERVIWREVAVLSPAIRDQRLTAVLEIELDRHRPQELAKLKQILKAAPEVLWCLEISGTSDMLLLVSAKNMARFNGFADQLAENPLVRRYKTSFVKKHVKTSGAVMLDGPDEAIAR